VTEFSHYQRLQDEALALAQPYPAGRFRGRGIVTCAGGPRYFTCAWVLVRMLRDVLKTNLPIQVWHLGAAEMDPLMRALLERYGAEVVDACSAGCGPPPAGHAIKPFAILHSRFEELVFVDADNLPTIDPERLFDSAAYRETGAVFWPDLQPLAAESLLWELCRVPFRHEPSFESGQIVLDKARSWKPLTLTLHMNEHSSFYFRYFYGDKDTFHLAWRRLEQPYAMPPHEPLRIPDDGADPLFTRHSFVLGQRDFDGLLIFQHRNWPKFVLLGRNPRYPVLPYEDECRGFLDELALQWDGRVRAPFDPPPGPAGPGARWFRYVRLSDSERWVELLPDNQIGRGSKEAERWWCVVPDGRTSMLEILGDEHVTCRLTRHLDGVWRGRWVRFERMPVELIPWEE